jgi:hypothetical protein
MIKKGRGEKNWGDQLSLPFYMSGGEILENKN